MFNFHGVLFFPITPFADDGTVDLEVLGRHVEAGVDKGAYGVFAACGTGEFFALDDREVASVAAVAVERARGRAPVFIGAGGGVGPARSRISIAAEAGADGVLLFAPDGLIADQQALVGYVAQIAATSELPLIVYQRGVMKLTTESAVSIARIPNVIGLKDGLGDIERVRRQVTAVTKERPDFLFINGLPTAELTMAAYRAVGVRHYSSAVFAFVPDVANAFRAAFDRGDDAEQHRLIETFFAPFAAIRARRDDYPVSLVKAGVAIGGLQAGELRPPLLAPEPADLEDLRLLIARAA